MQKQNIIGERQIIYVDAVKKEESLQIRVAGYARVSSDSEDQLNSFSAQVNHYSRMIEQNPKWQLADIYADEGVSGVSLNKRDDFNRMISDCRKGKIDYIITKSLSRFARNTLDALSVIRELKQLGISVFFEKENMDTGKLSSDNLLSLHATIAQQESVNLSQNCKRGHRAKMKRGEYVSNTMPYGYRLENKLPAIYEPEAVVIRRIFKEYIDGMGCVQIAQGLTADGIPRKDGKLNWRPQAIIALIRNERYIGDMLFQKTFNADDMPYTKTVNIGQLPKYYVKNTHEPIVTRKEFELANSLLASRSEQFAKKEVTDRLLSKKIICADCKKAYRKKITNNKFYWVCRNYDHNIGHCEGGRIAETDIYTAFLRLYNTLKANCTCILYPMIDKLERFADAKQKSNIQLTAINQDIAELHRQNQVLTEFMKDGILDSAIFISQSDELNKRLQLLKREKQLLLNEQEDNTMLDRTEKLVYILEQGPEIMCEVDEEIFSEIIEKILVDKTELTFILCNSLKLKERIG